MLQRRIILYPQRICKTLAGNLAYTVGRLMFRPRRPMLVEHVGGVYLEHDLSGRIMTDGYGAEYNIVYVQEEDPTPAVHHGIMRKEAFDADAGNIVGRVSNGNLPDGAVPGKQRHPLVRSGAAGPFAYCRFACDEELAAHDQKVSVSDHF